MVTKKQKFTPPYARVVELRMRRDIMLNSFSGVGAGTMNYEEEERFTEED